MQFCRAFFIYLQCKYKILLIIQHPKNTQKHRRLNRKAGVFFFCLFKIILIFAYVEPARAFIL